MRVAHLVTNTLTVIWLDINSGFKYIEHIFDISGVVLLT